MVNLSQKPSAEIPSPIISSQNLGWESLIVEEFEQPPGSGEFDSEKEHTIALCLATKPYRIWQSIGDRSLLKVIEYINEHLNQSIKTKDLAEYLGISQFHFSRLFKQSTGISPHQYVMQQRIELAKRLLKKADRSIADIALDCGFNSQSHLGKYFRAITGMTPKDYRQNR